MASSMGNMHPQLREVLVEPTWQTALGAEFDKPYMDALQTFLDSEWESHAVYPPATFIFRQGWERLTMICCRFASAACALIMCTVDRLWARSL